MRRRAVLALMGSAVAAGCSSLGGAAEPPALEDKTIAVLSRECVASGAHDATVSFGADASQVTIAGTIRVPRTDQLLYVNTRNGVGDDERAADVMEVRIHYLPPDADSGVDGSDCAGTLEYEAQVAFSSAPSAIIVRHVTDDDGDAVLQTITTAEP